MPTSLCVRLRHKISFAEVLRHTPDVLRQMLRVESVPHLICKSPPASEADDTENQDVWVNFKGAYIAFAEAENSTVSMLAVTTDPRHPSYGTYVDCSISRTPGSNVLAAALIIALSQLMNGTILDDAHHWVDRDEATADQFLAALQLHEPQTDFQAAINAVYARQAAHQRNPTELKS